jgi:DinB superfamily
MSDPTGIGGPFLERLDKVQVRLAAHASAHPAPGLTEPDQPSGERWDWGQVWAHLAEFVPYWLGQARLILGRPRSEDPVPFGRTKTDAGRVAAIEADRGRPPPELMGRLTEQLGELRAFTRGLSEHWDRRGRHPTLGVMELPRLYEEFLIGHLEAHADQLDGLAAGRASDPGH